MLSVVTIEVPSISSDSESILVSTSHSDHVSFAIVEWPGGSKSVQVPDSPSLVLAAAASLVEDSCSVGVALGSHAISFWVSEVVAVATHPLEFLELAVVLSHSKCLAQSRVSVT